MRQSDAALIDTLRSELAVGHALAKAYPWLFKVERLPGAGPIGAPGWLHGFEAANDTELR